MQHACIRANILGCSLGSLANKSCRYNVTDEECSRPNALLDGLTDQACNIYNI